jgi:hypothetical protein
MLSGAANSIRDSYRRSADAQRVVDSTTDIVRQSQAVRRDVDALISRRQSEFDRNYGSNEDMLTDINVRLDSFRGKIRDLNNVVSIETCLFRSNI